MAKVRVKQAKKTNGYQMPEPLPAGLVLKDVQGKEWKLGSSIGKGGFGEIYMAQAVAGTGKGYDYVIKIEPHGNGPLYVEMQFYIRNAKAADIEAYKTEKNLKRLGMPAYLGSGSHTYLGTKYRFIVMDKFKEDLNKLFEANSRKFPAGTAYRVSLQMVDVLEYIHGRGYVHADLKGANILVSQQDENQTFLVDFGLAGKFSADSVFKPDPKKMHDGTPEYLSRDAHQGVLTRRGDLEILGYNLIQWLGGTLPWEKNTKNPKTVEAEKIKHMKNVPAFLKSAFKNDKVPDSVEEFLDYVNSVEFNEEPDYEKVRKILLKGLKAAGSTPTSPLAFRSGQKRKSTGSSPRQSKLTKKVTKAAKSPRAKSATLEASKENKVVTPRSKNKRVIKEKPTIEEVSENSDSDEVIEDSDTEKPVSGRKMTRQLFSAERVTLRPRQKPKSPLKVTPSKSNVAKAAESTPTRPATRVRRLASVSTDAPVVEVQNKEMLRIRKLAQSRKMGKKTRSQTKSLETVSD